MDAVVSHVGLDMHKRFSRATARDSANRVVWRRRLEHTDRMALAAELSKLPADTPVIMESSFGWGWMSDLVLSVGAQPYLANSKKVAGWRQARGLAKNNKLDADLLSELWLQQPRWWEVWWAPPEVRSRREWLRYRMSLVNTQTSVKNRIHAVLHRHGIIHEFSDLFGRQGRGLLNQLTAKNDITLPESARCVLKGYLQQLDHLRRQIAQVTRIYRKELNRTPEGERLKSIPGISWILAFTILAEIGVIARFPLPENLASYSLVIPRDNDSGEERPETPRGRRVGRIGRRTLKWAFIEAAHGAVRKGGRFRELFNRHTDNGQKDRNRGYIVVAHAIARIAHVLLTKEVDYTDTPPPRPGSRKASRRGSKKSASRPEKG